MADTTGVVVKVTAVEVFLLHERFVIVKLTGSDGTAGWGSAAFHGGETTARIAARLGNELIGRNAFAVEANWQDLFRKGYRLGTTGSHMAALGGLDIALWDLKGRALSAPVWELLGGRIRDRVPMYSSLMKRGLPAAEEIERVARRMEQGYRAVKFHTGVHWGLGAGDDNTVEIVGAVRDAFGGRKNLEIMVDLNHAYTVSDAIRVGRKLEGLEVTWMEEPIAPWDYAGYDRLQHALDLPIAAGEQEYNLWQFRDLMTVAHVDVVQPNITSCGGFTQGKKIAALAEAFNVPLHFHNTEPTLTTAAHLHLWATSPMCGGVHEYYGEDEHPLRDVTPLLAEPLDVVNGHLAVPDGPGLGVEVDEALVRRVGALVTP